MKKVTLRIKKKIRYLDLRNLSLVNDIQLNFKNIHKIKVLYNNKIVEIGEIFSIKISSTKLNFNKFEIYGCNKFCHFLGFNWKKDFLFVDSDLGNNIGYGMKSGEIHINGSVNDFLGSEMNGGLLHVKGDAKNFVGAGFLGNRIGMCGGEIIIEGNAGDYLGFFMRRGLIIIKRNVGKFCGFKMIAGTLILFQGYESFLGLSMKRGSIILLKNNSLNYKLQNKKSPIRLESSFLCYLKKYLMKKFSINLAGTKFHKYYCDRSINGIGEIIVRIG